MHTDEYILLFDRNEELKSIFLTDFILEYPDTDRSQDMIKAYRFLIHAEIEFYFESVIKKVIKESVDKWLNNNEFKKPLLSILAFHNIKFNNIPTRASEINSGNDLTFRISRCVNDFKNIIKRNNGIKEENILPLLVNIGMDASELDPLLLNNLSSFGRNRGDIAHNSFSVISLINPVDETDLVDKIIDDIKEIDYNISLL